MDLIRCKHCELVLTEDVNEACGFCPNCYENSRPDDAWQEPLPPADALKLADDLLREADPEAWREQKALAFIWKHADSLQILDLGAKTTDGLCAICRFLAGGPNPPDPEPWMAEDWTPLMDSLVGAWVPDAEGEMVCVFGADRALDAEEIATLHDDPARTCEGCQYEDQMRCEEPCLSCSVGRVSNWRPIEPLNSRMPCRTCLHGRLSPAINYYCNSCRHRFENKWQPKEPAPRLSKPIVDMTDNEYVTTAREAGLRIGYMYSSSHPEPYEAVHMNAEDKVFHSGMRFDSPEAAKAFALSYAAYRAHKLKDGCVVMNATGPQPGMGED